MHANVYSYLDWFHLAPHEGVTDGGPVEVLVEAVLVLPVIVAVARNDVPRKPGLRYNVHIRYINSIHSVRMELMGSKSRYYHCIYTHILCTSQYVVNTGISVSFREVHFMYIRYVLFSKILTAYQYVLF